MLINPGYGNILGGGGAGFQIFTQSNNDPGVYADAAARDVYFDANPSELARLDADEFLIIKLLDDGLGAVAYQQRASGNWVDVTSLVQGEQGPPGDGTQQIVEVISTYTALITDDIVICTGTFTVNLPPLSTATKQIDIKSISPGGIITVDPDGSETIEGNSTKDVAPDESITIAPTTLGNWLII